VVEVHPRNRLLIVAKDEGSGDDTDPEEVDGDEDKK
jgi:hypothetical protein